MIESLSTDDKYKFVHNADNNNLLLGRHSMDYMKKLTSKIEKGPPNNVQRLFVISSDDELLNPQLWLFLVFHQDHEHYNSKIISKEDFDRLQTDNGYHCPQRMDFGVYGVKYAYQSKQQPGYPANSDYRKPIGVFTANSNIINKLTLFFDNCWNSYASWHVPEDFFIDIRDKLSFQPSGRFSTKQQKVKEINTVGALERSKASIPNLLSYLNLEKTASKIKDIRPIF